MYYRICEEIKFAKFEARIASYKRFVLLQLRNPKVPSDKLKIENSSKDIITDFSRIKSSSWSSEIKVKNLKTRSPPTSN